MFVDCQIPCPNLYLMIKKTKTKAKHTSKQNSNDTNETGHAGLQRAVRRSGSIDNSDNSGSCSSYHIRSTSHDLRPHRSSPHIAFPHADPSTSQLQSHISRAPIESQQVLSCSRTT